VEAELRAAESGRLADIADPLAAAIDALEQASTCILQTIRKEPDSALAASFNYLMLTGYACGGWQMGRAALAALRSGDDPEFSRTKIATATFYAQQILPKTAALLTAIRHGASGAMDLPEEQF
jgi:acyl-CoA dehydrogenase